MEAQALMEEVRGILGEAGQKYAVYEIVGSGDDADLSRVSDPMSREAAMTQMRKLERKNKGSKYAVHGASKSESLGEAKKIDWPKVWQQLQKEFPDWSLRRIKDTVSSRGGIRMGDADIKVQRRYRALISEAKDPADLAYDLFKTHDKLKALLMREVNEVDKVWARALSEIERGKKYGGASLAAVDYLNGDMEPMKALSHLQRQVQKIIEHAQDIRRKARMKSTVPMKAVRSEGWESDTGLDLLAEDDDLATIDEMYADIGKDAPYVGSDNPPKDRGLGDNAPQVVKTAKMRVPQKSVEIVKKGVEKSKTAGSYDLNVVGTGKDYVMVSGAADKLTGFARHVAARSSTPTVVSTAFGAGGLMAKEDRDLLEKGKKFEGADLLFDFPDDVFDDLTEGDVLRAALYEATYYQSGKNLYVDTAYINAVKGAMKDCTLSHMGFGEFTFKCGKVGEIEFDRMRGKDFPGQSGRSHKVYDNKAGKLVSKMMAAMKGKAKASKAESLEGYENELAKLAEAITFKGPHHAVRKDDPKTIAKIRKMSESGSGKIDGVFVDGLSANLIVQVYDALKTENRAKFAAMPVGEMGTVARRVASG